MKEINPESEVIKNQNLSLDLTFARYANEKHEELKNKVIKFKETNTNKNKTENTKLSKLLKEIKEKQKQIKIPKKLIIAGVMSLATLSILVGNINKANDKEISTTRIEQEVTTEEPDILDKIVAKYNQTAEQDKKISRDDILILKEQIGDGQIYKEEEDGIYRYHQNYLAGLGEQPEGRIWLDDDDGKNIEAIVVLNSKNKEKLKAITGIVKTEDEGFKPLSIEALTINGHTLITGDKNKIQFKEDTDLESIANELLNIEKQQQNEQEIEEEER